MSNGSEAAEVAAAFLFGTSSPLVPDESVEEVTQSKGDYSTYRQWATVGNGNFSPVGNTIPKLPAGVYQPFSTPTQWGLEKIDIVSDGIYELPDTVVQEVLQEVETFWDSEVLYRKHNLIFKRGLILHGPVGGGKTTCVKILMSKLIQRDGVVVLVSHVGSAISCIKALRRIEPNRNIIIVLEDIDEILAYNGEATVLSLLDGEHNVDRVLHLATTNFPERLGARIINRPSRFDRRVYVGMPSSDARMTYLRKATDAGLDIQTAENWVQDTDGFSIAHLRELVASVYCLRQPYDDVLSRLKEMRVQVKSDEDFVRKPAGFVAGMAGSTRVVA